jgi:hypothetical protein
MKNTTILIILLLFVSSTLYIKQREGLEIAPLSTDGIKGVNLDKINTINDINRKINDMKVDYKVFNDETTNMANQQISIFYLLAVITAVVLIFTMYYLLK